MHADGTIRSLTGSSPRRLMTSPEPPLDQRSGEPAGDIDVLVVGAGVTGIYQLYRALEAGFSARSSLRTWLTGILKHKIVDAIRKKGRGPIISSLDEECRVDDFDALFDETGHWDNPPATWGDPEAELSAHRLSPRGFKPFKLGKFASTTWPSTVDLPLV